METARRAGGKDLRFWPMRVQSFHRHREIGDFAPDTGELRTYQRTESDNAEPRSRGHFAVLNSMLLVVFRDDEGTLMLRTPKASIPLDDPTVTHWRHDAGESQLDVHSGELAFTVRYRPDSGFETAGREDPLPACDPEDFDFGLFLANLTRDRERRDLIYRDEPGS